MRKHHQAFFWSKAFAALLVLVNMLGPLCAQATLITNVADIVGNSTASNLGGAANDTRVLHSGYFEILSPTALVNLFVTASPHLAINAGSSFTLGSLQTHTNVLMRINKLFHDGGTLLAHGGVTTNSFGLQSAGVWHSAGSMTGIGGAGYEARGMHNTGFTYSGTGSVTGRGGSGDLAHGINTGGIFTMSGSGSLEGFGGTGPSAYGLFITRLDYTGSGAITGTGGANDFAYGIYVHQAFTHAGSGTITGTGGSSLAPANSSMAGIRFNTALDTISSGSIKGTGGAGTDARGIYVGANFTHAGTGAVTVEGGSGTRSSGMIVFNNLNYTGSGPIAATGGIGNQAHGLRIENNLSHTGSGTLTATGGAGVGNHGVSVRGLASIDGTVHIMPGSVENRAFYVNNTANVPTAASFGASSRLLVGFDGATGQAGQFIARAGDIVITPGASAGVGTVKNAASMNINQQYTSLFMEATGGTIQNAFTFVDTPTFSFSLDKRGNQYYLRLTRRSQMVHVPQVAISLMNNEQALVESFGALTGLTTPESAPLRAYADAFESAASAQEATALAIALQRNLAPHAMSRVSRLVVRNSRMPRMSLHKALDFTGNTLATSRNAGTPLYNKNNYFAASNNSADTLTDAGSGLFEHPAELGWKVWTEVYGQRADINAANRQFSNATERTAGANIGVRRMLESGHSIALGGHYLQSDLQSNDNTDITTNNYGLSLGGRFALPELALQNFGQIAPAVEVFANYSALEIEQERYFFGQRADSEANGHLYQAGATLYAPIIMNKAIWLTPEAGLTYSVVDIDDFYESNHTQLGLEIRLDRYSSLLAHAGVRLDARLTPAINAHVGTTVSYDVLDEEVKLHNAFRSAQQVRFTTTGEENNSITTDIQAGLNMDLWQNASLTTEYAFGFAKDYESHALSVNLNIRF